MTDEELAAGWFVEVDGRPVALLTEPQYYDMFWVSLTLTPLVDDLTERLRICTDRLWWLENRLKLHNRLTDAASDQTFPAGDVFTDSGRVILRAICLP
jgi:hypothetical protein